MSNGCSKNGGSRPGSGRPRQGTEPRVPLCFSVDPSTRDKARKLRSAGFPLNLHIEDLIADKYTCYFNGPTIVGED